MNETDAMVKRFENVVSRRSMKSVIGTPMPMMITPTVNLIADTA